MSVRKVLNGLAAASIGAAATLPAVAAENGATIAERVQKLTRASQWKPVAAIPIAFPTHHPQGMVKIGDEVFFSSVEIKVPTKRYAQPVDGYDRDTGEGVGHLFKMDLKGNLIGAVTLGEGSIYHPGGIDFDGSDIWVPTAEYRPDGRSIVYRVDPATLKATEVFRFPDHIGGIVHNTDDHTLHGVSWGSRRFYRWTLGSDGRVTDADQAPEKLRTLNPSHYLDYQDCKYLAGQRQMLCTGVTEMRVSPTAPLFRLGGVDLIDLKTARPVFQTPILAWTPSGLDLTHNPVWIEPSETGLRGYFIPEDDTSALYIYEVDAK